MMYKSQFWNEKLTLKTGFVLQGLKYPDPHSSPVGGGVGLLSANK